MKTRIAITVLLAAALTTPGFAASRTHWVATWGPSPSPQLPDTASTMVSELISSTKELIDVNGMSTLTI